ncbi:MAG: DNA repair protein RadC [Anaerolineae bacterium]|nr:DNA repair protein RadC [Anaerolineae bacterium]
MPTEEQPAYRLDHFGSNGLSSPELLAVLLGAKDGLDLATDLICTIGGLSELPKKSKQELAQIPGIGEKRALSLVALGELSRRVFRESRGPDRQQIRSPADAASLLMPEMILLEQEHLKTILLDTRNNVLSVPTIYIGNTNSAAIRAGEVFKHAIRANAVAMIIAHNHPSGEATPSPEDINVTKTLIQAGRLLEVSVLDHIIIGNKTFTSMAERQLCDFNSSR